MGAWHVIAHIPYWPERGKVASRDEYQLRADGRIDNDFVFRKSFDAPEQRWHGISRVVPGSHGAHWQVQFIWPFKADLLVLEVDPDYRWALLGHPQRKYAWVFAREPRMDDAMLDQLRQRFKRYGYDPAQLLRVAQFADQLEPSPCADCSRLAGRSPLPFCRAIASSACSAAARSVVRSGGKGFAMTGRT